ncbi:hypothetical protein A1O1_05981 [Capronia coronata CBS 617.96]|uniref:Uncharacterized protein n=1 Tax=Capronia coronata CBS 617.96 TaxID=1182541 RepID=W9Y7K3_9EURO|nr:uncharacterized protein A1O1_05981 [Capronia coronata CBS 617.96]EXJ85615.1 hypothetical protein A1O1_05981 [Capronia coronata CBS 617.96]
MSEDHNRAATGSSGPGNAASFPLAAQISLKEFEFPDFPPQASRLRQLTLTADIKLDEYQGKVQVPSDAITTQPPLPDLPQSITHLSLELFGLGFPGKPPFLGRLARALPNITTLTFFSCLIDGLDDASRKDAEAFFRLLPNLQELHLIDSFARPGFFKAIGEIFEKRSNGGKSENEGKGEDESEGDPKGGSGGQSPGGLKMVDVSYTFRGHEDSDFLARVQGEELPNLIVKGVVGASFDFVPEVVDQLAGDDEGGAGAGNGKKDTDNKKVAEGILPFASDGRAPAALKKRFETLSSGGLQSLKVLNLGMWSLRPAEVGQVLYACAGGGGGGGQTGLADVTVSVLLEENWMETFIEGFGRKDVVVVPDLEGIEVVGVPDRPGVEGDDWKHGLALATRSDVEKLNDVCPRLGKFGMSLLKVRSAPHVLFFKEQESWVEQ